MARSATRVLHDAQHLSAVGGVPAVGYVRLDVVTADRPPAPARVWLPVYR